MDIGELLLKENLITAGQLQAAVDHRRHHGGTLRRAFVTLGLALDRHITSVLSLHCCVPPIDIEDFEVSPAIALILPADTARKYQALPLARYGATLAIAVADPTNTRALEDIKLLTGCNLEPFVASEAAIEEAIERCYEASSPAESPGDTENDGLIDIDLGALQPPEPQEADGAATRVASERTAWAYVTAMHAAAVGGPRAPLRGIVEDVADMRATLIRERDEARARVLRLEARVAEARRLLARALGQPMEAPPAERVGGEKDAADDECIDEHEVPAQRPVALAGAPRETKAVAKTRITLGELLMDKGLVSLEQCLEARRDQTRNGGDLATAFVRLGFLRDDEIVAALSIAYGIPSICLERFEVHPAVIELLAPEVARKYQMLPLSVSSTLVVAVADPANQLAIDTVRSLTGWNVEPVVASASALHAALARYYGPTGSPRRAAQNSADRGLWLAWSRREPSRGDRRGNPERDGDPPAA
jgi:hypothetical protein